MATRDMCTDGRSDKRRAMNVDQRFGGKCEDGLAALVSATAAARPQLFAFASWVGFGGGDCFSRLERNLLMGVVANLWAHRPDIACRYMPVTLAYLSGKGSRRAGSWNGHTSFRSIDQSIARHHWPALFLFLLSGSSQLFSSTSNLHA